MHSAIDSDVACAVQAIIHRITNAKTMLMTPIWPITTLDGNFERVFATFKTDGPKKDEPNPAIVKLIERMIRTRVWFEVPVILTAIIPIIMDKPESNDPRTIKKSIA